MAGFFPGARGGLRGRLCGEAVIEREAVALRPAGAAVGSRRLYSCQCTVHAEAARLSFVSFVSGEFVAY